MSRLGTYKIQGIDYDLDDLTLDEMEEIETLCGGKPYATLTFGAASELKALVFVLMKRSQPDIRIEDVGKVKMVDFIQADEDMPDLPKDDADSQQNGSVRDDSGTLLSAGSIRG